MPGLPEGVSVEVRTQLNRTESEEKLRAALFAIFEDVPFERKEDNLSGTSRSAQDLEKLRAKVFEKRILDTVRSRLFRNSSGTQSFLLLHKQALAAGRVALVDSDEESPLGAVRISFSAQVEGELEHFINWFSPETKEGIVVASGGNANSEKNGGQGSFVS